MLFRSRNLVFDGYDMPDYIGSGTVSPDGKELLFCSSQGYVRRLALASCGKAAGLVNVRFSAQTKEERAATNTEAAPFISPIKIIFPNLSHHNIHQKKEFCCNQNQPAPP